MPSARWTDSVGPARPPFITVIVSVPSARHRLSLSLSLSLSSRRLHAHRPMHLIRSYVVHHGMHRRSMNRAHERTLAPRSPLATFPRYVTLRLRNLERNRERERRLEKKAETGAEPVHERVETTNEARLQGSARDISPARGSLGSSQVFFALGRGDLVKEVRRRDQTLDRKRHRAYD